MATKKKATKKKTTTKRTLTDSRDASTQKRLKTAAKKVVMSPSTRLKIEKQKQNKKSQKIRANQSPSKRKPISLKRPKSKK